jgi:hypothetical protein
MFDPRDTRFWIALGVIVILGVLCYARYSSAEEHTDNPAGHQQECSASP